MTRLYHDHLLSVHKIFTVYTHALLRDSAAMQNVYISQTHGSQCTQKNTDVRNSHPHSCSPANDNRQKHPNCSLCKQVARFLLLLVASVSRDDN